MTVKINLPLNPPVEIEIAEDLDVAGIVATLAAHPAIIAIAEKEGRESWFEAFQTWDSIEKSTAEDFARKYLEGGIDAVAEYILDQEYENSIDDEFHRQVRPEIIKAITRIIETVVAEAAQFESLDEYLDEAVIEEIAEGVADEMKEVACDAMGEKDESSPSDLIPSHAKVELNFLPDGQGLGWDDLMTDAIDGVQTYETVRPTANFLRFLRLVNVSPSEFIAIVRNEYGVDPSSPVFDENVRDYMRERYEALALEWRAVIELENGLHLGENIRKLPLSSKYEIAEWNERVAIVATMKDHDRPASLSPKNLMNVLDNARQGGNPLFFCRVPLRDLLGGKFNEAFTAEGGYVGIHNFANGSGYIETPDAPVLIDPSKGVFRVGIGYGVDEVYGIIGSYYDVRTEPYTAPEWQRVRESTWRREGEGGFVTITLAKDSVMNEFWVQSFDEEGREAGARATPEVWSDFDSAKAEGDDILKEPITSSPTMTR